MIERIVVLMLENNSFDRLLGFLTAEGRGDIDGVDPAHPRTNPDTSGNPVGQEPTTLRELTLDPGHDYPDVNIQLANQNQGFVRSFQTKYAKTPPPAEEVASVMGWYPRMFLPALHTLAENFVVCDRWFSSVPGPTWCNRFFVHSGTALGHVDMPEGPDSPGIHIYDQRTIYDLLEAHHIPWRIYYGDVPQSAVMTRQLAFLPTERYHKMADFAADAARPDFPNYVFIEPGYEGATANDQHPPHDMLRGDQLIADVYNTLCANPTMFARTLFVVLYDEHGGFYDHVVPPACISPDGRGDVFKFDRLGLRVPAVLISPLLDAGAIHTVFDHASLPRAAIDLFGLDLQNTNPLGQRVAKANNPLHDLKLRTTARPMQTLPPINPKPAQTAPQLAGHPAALASFTAFLEGLLDDGPDKTALQARAADANGTGEQQAALARDRVAAFVKQEAG